MAYEKGQGIARNLAKIARWYRSAAKRGHTNAQYRLARAYMLGQGVKRNRTEAYKWAHLAAQEGDKIAAKLRDRVAKKMSSRQIARAKSGATNPKRNKAKNNSKRDLVKFVQRGLKRVGFKVGKIDGVLGPTTRAAIRAYQRSLAMKATGVADQSLVKLLKSDPDAQMASGRR